MGKQAELLEFYEQVLASLSVYPDDDGLLSLYIPAEEGGWNSTPCTFNDKRLALPNRQILKAANWDEILPFHPLSEHLLKGESEVLKLTKRLVLFRLRQTTQVLMTQLMHIAANPEVQNELKPDQAKFLQHIPQANEKSEKMLGKLLDKHFDKIVSIYLKRKGKVEGAEMRRAAKITFPIYAELQTKGTKVFDVDMGSAKVKKQVLQLFEFVFGIDEENDAMIVGSNANTAPYFHALMHAHYRVGKILSSLVHKYRKFIDHHEQFKIDTSFMDDLDDLDQWKDIIPALPGNKGAKGKDESDEDEATAHRAPPKVDPMKRVGNRARVEPEDDDDATAPVTTSPSTMPGVVPMAADAAGAAAPAASAPKSSGGGISWRSVMQSQQPQRQVGGQNSPHGSPFQLSPTPAMGPPQPQPQQFGGHPGTGYGYGQPQPQQFGNPGFAGPGYGQPAPVGGGYGGYGSPMGGGGFPRGGGGGGSRTL